MQKLGYGTFPDYLKFHGRTLADDLKQAVFFNWTCSGLSCTFTGKTLTAKLTAIPSPSLAGPDQPEEYPYIGISINGSRELLTRLRVDDGGQEYTLFSAEKEGTYTVRVIKLSENMRGKCGVLELSTDGGFHVQMESESALHIEAVGDSITCGFGIEASAPMAPFLPEEENGWITYASLACASLQAELSTVCVSGISMSEVKPNGGLPGLPGMEDLYEYTDRIYESMEGKASSFTRWDFPTHPVDAVIINIGTNDANMIRFQGAERTEYIGPLAVVQPNTP